LRVAIPLNECKAARPCMQANDCTRRGQIAKNGLLKVAKTIQGCNCLTNYLEYLHCVARR